MTALYLAWLSEHWPLILAAAAVLDLVVWVPILYVLHRNRNRHPLT